MRPWLATPLLVATVVLACQPAAAPASPPIRLGYKVVAEYPHDPGAYTQGLTFDEGRLYESVGQYGKSGLREVDLETGKLKRNHLLPAELFGEGMAIIGSRIFQLTWREGMGLVYDKERFEVTGSFQYSGEGWGLTSEGQRLLMSDGSSQLRWLDAQTLREVGRLQVTDQGRPLERLNELEFVQGQVLANVYMTDFIARIDPASGRVTGWLDLTGLLKRDQLEPGSQAEVLNGIAYEPASKRLFVTGKYWPKLFEIEVTAKP